MKFADIPFRDDVKRRLREMVDTGRLPHALLIEGPSGSGKFALARATAQYLHCSARTADGEPCGVCPACLQHQGFNHIDTVFSFPVYKKGGSSALSSDFQRDFCDFVSESPFMDYGQWLERIADANAQPRIYVEEGEQLIRRLGFTAHGARYKVVLFWLPERMMEQTANKLLKLIEEPADDTRLILVSNDPRGILPTIYSRTQRITVSRYTDREIQEYLMRARGVTDGAAAEASRLAEGDMNRALGLLAHTSQPDSIRLDMFIQLMRLAYMRDIVALRTWGNNLAASGREAMTAFFDYAARMLRENYIYALRVPQLNCMTPEEEQFSSRFSRFVNERNIEDLMRVMDEARVDVAANANGKIVCFDVAIKMILLLKR